MMHLTCTNMPVESLETTLKQCKENNIQNILALRGDPPKGQDNFEAVEGGFSCALDLVKYIRWGRCTARCPCVLMMTRLRAAVDGKRGTVM